MDGVTADGAIGNNTVDEQFLSTAINDVARAMTSLKMGVPRTTTAETNDSIKFLTRDPFLKDLFDVHSGMKLRSVDDLMKEYPYLPLFAIFSLLLADTMEGSVTTIMEIIQSQQKQQKATSESIIKDVSYMQTKREELAFAKKYDWKARVGIDVTGANRKEDSENQWWKLIIGIGVVLIIVAVSIVTAVVTGGASIGAAIGAGAAVGAAITGALMAVGAVFSLIANLVKDPKHQKNFMLVASIFNPIQAIADGAIDAYCEKHDIDPNDEKIQKARMWTNLAATIISAIILVAIGCFTGGTTTVSGIANIINALSGIFAGLSAIATGVLEIRNAERELERAEMKKVLNQVQASVERMKNILDMIGINIELWTEMFSNDMTIMRGEYDRAARMLKEYNDQKVAIARNIRA